MIPPAHHRTRREQRDDDEAAHCCPTYSIMGQRAVAALCKNISATTPDQGTKRRMRRMRRAAALRRRFFASRARKKINVKLPAKRVFLVTTRSGRGMIYDSSCLRRLLKLLPFKFLGDLG